MRCIAATVALVCAVPGVLLAQSQTSESGLPYSMVGGGSAGGKTPMIIFLHGTGGGTGVWGAYVNAARSKGYICVIPSSTGTGAGDPKSGNTGGDNMKRWAEVDLPKLCSLAKEIQRKHGADPRRTYIAGFSNGGFYSCETGLRNPEVFSAVLCMGGGCNVHQFSDAAKNVGVYFVHGTADTSVKFESGKNSSERLKSAGFKDVVFKEKPNGQHVVFSDEIEPFFAWLSKQKRRTTPGANSAVGWGADLDAAIKSGKRVLLYLYSPKDDASDLADWFETEALVDPAVVAASAEFACVKLNRDEASLPPELAAKKPCLLVFEIDKDKPKILSKFESISSGKAVADKLKTLKRK